MYVFLQYFDTVGWVFWPVKTVARITYIVLEETLNPAQSTPHDIVRQRHRTATYLHSPKEARPKWPIANRIVMWLMMTRCLNDLAKIYQIRFQIATTGAMTESRQRLQSVRWYAMAMRQITNSCKQIEIISNLELCKWLVHVSRCDNLSVNKRTDLSVSRSVSGTGAGTWPAERTEDACRSARRLAFSTGRALVRVETVRTRRAYLTQDLYTVTACCYLRRKKLIRCKVFQVSLYSNHLTLVGGRCDMQLSRIITDWLYTHAIHADH